MLEEAYVTALATSKFRVQTHYVSNKALIFAIIVYIIHAFFQVKLSMVAKFLH
jgi:hypothetical protein